MPCENKISIEALAHMKRKMKKWTRDHRKIVTTSISFSFLPKTTITISSLNAPSIET